MKFKNRESERVELQDGRVVWLSRSPAVMSIIVAKVGRWWQKKKYFVVTSVRGKDTPDFQGYHCCPCGYLDWDENGFEGAAREVWEETNLNVVRLILSNSLQLDSKKHKVKIVDHHYGDSPWSVNSSPYANKQNVTIGYALAFQVKTADVLPKLSGVNVNREDYEEVASADWTPLEDILARKERFAFNHDLQIISYIKHLKTKSRFRLGR